MNYFNNIVIVALCLVGIQQIEQQPVTNNLASENDYKFSLGERDYQPEENIKDFFKKKSKFEQNLYEDTYYVILQFEKSPSKDQQYDMRQEITLIKSITENTFLASFSKKIRRKTFKKFDARAMIPLTSEMKLEKGLKAMMQKQKMMEVNIVVGKGIEKEKLMEALEAIDIEHAISIFKETTDKYMVNINEAQMMTIASWSNVIRLEVGGLR